MLVHNSCLMVQKTTRWICSRALLNTYFQVHEQCQGKCLVGLVGSRLPLPNAAVQHVHVQEHHAMLQSVGATKGLALQKSITERLVQYHPKRRLQRPCMHVEPGTRICLRHTVTTGFFAWHASAQTDAWTINRSRGHTGAMLVCPLLWRLSNSMWRFSNSRVNQHQYQKSHA